MQLHAELLRFSDKDTRHRGEYKTHPNHVAAFGPDGKMLGIVFETSSPFDTPFEMRKLLDWHREAEAMPGLWHPLLRIGVFIVRFLAVHPFQDGNGRLSRVMTTLLLLRAGYAYVPYSSLESVIEANKEAYYLALRQTQTTLRESEPEWHPWMLFFLKALKTQKDRLLSRLDMEQQALATLTPLARSISELLAGQSGRVVINGYPTGVAVAWGMNHGGPYPSSTSRSTSTPKPGAVGTSMVEPTSTNGSVMSRRQYRSLAEMSAGIAHEINQPLGAILSNADAADLLLQSGRATPEALREILADIGDRYGDVWTDGERAGFFAVGCFLRLCMDVEAAHPQIFASQQ
jgi:signal transduction histidine kinase